MRIRHGLSGTSMGIKLKHTHECGLILMAKEISNPQLLGVDTATLNRFLPVIKSENPILLKEILFVMERA